MFALLPELVERAGNAEHEGAITAVYTVLSEGDEPNDPLSEAARAVLDGHLVLSRRLAERGQHPAIDLEVSSSRVMSDVVTPEHAVLARRFRRLCALYDANADLIDVGAYVPGNNAELDEAVEARARLEAFLVQRVDEPVTFADSLEQLDAVVAPVAA